MKKIKPVLTQRVFKQLSAEKQEALRTILAAMRDNDRCHALTCDSTTDLAGNMVGRKLKPWDAEARLYWSLWDGGWIAKTRSGHSSLPTATYQVADVCVPWVERQLSSVT